MVIYKITENRKYGRIPDQKLTRKLGVPNQVWKYLSGNGDVI